MLPTSSRLSRRIDCCHISIGVPHPGVGGVRGGVGVPHPPGVGGVKGGVGVPRPGVGGVRGGVGVPHPGVRGGGGYDKVNTAYQM